MKKIIIGIIAASILVSCVEDEVIIEKKHEKTKFEKLPSTMGKEVSKESDSIRPVLSIPSKNLEPGDGTDPGAGIDPGEVGPVVQIPPK